MAICAFAAGAQPSAASAWGLDRATAFYVADSAQEDSGVFWVCGEDDDCVKAVRGCYWTGLSHRRIDCVVGYKNRVWSDNGLHSKWLRMRCGVVVSVLLKGNRISEGSYSCKSELMHPGSQWRFVRPSRQVRRRRFHNHGWLPRRNVYGFPRFDPKHDVYVP